MNDFTSDPKLTDEEIQAVFDQPGADEEDELSFHHRVADAATAKALYWAVDWLRNELFETVGADSLEVYLVAKGIERRAIR
ncbi:MAG: hypothetical protein Q8Q08_00955 [Candidatus Omnitrophota bacterium]|nr:hypothetical protein [Candidatus Omnitrophota bacterium]